MNKTKKEVYIIVSPQGSIGYNIFNGTGTVYVDQKKAEEALKSTNEWSRTKGYGIYELMTLEVEE